MAADSRITLEMERHGTFTTDELTLDLMVARHLPASPAQIRALVQERVGEELDYSDVTGVVEGLIILASFETGGSA